MITKENRYKECARKSRVDNRIEEIRAQLEEVLERLGQIEVTETSLKTWRTRR